jgi:hypothetical protein
MPSKSRQLAVVSVAAFGVVYLAFVHREVGRSLDQAALVDRTASIEVSSAEVGLVDAGPAVVAIVLLATTAWLRQDWRLALGVAGMIGLSSAAALGLAHVLPQVDPDQPSFPSGDATLGMAVACGLLLVGAPTRRGSMVPIAAGIAIVVGVVLVALDWHRPAEVAGGYFLAVAVACAVVPLVRGRLAAPAPERQRHPAVAIGVVVTALVLVAAAVQSLLYAIDHAKLGDWLAFAAAEVLLVALAWSLLAALRRAVSPMPARCGCFGR